MGSGWGVQGQGWGDPGSGVVWGQGGPRCGWGDLHHDMTTTTPYVEKAAQTSSRARPKQQCSDHESLDSMLEVPVL